MAEKSRFFDSSPNDIREYSADEFAEVFRTFFSTGIVKDGASNSSANNALKVTKGSASGTVEVSPGYAMLEGHWYHNDQKIVLNIPPTTDTPRKDLVILRFDKMQREIKATYRQGTATSEPPMIDSPRSFDLPLAYLFIAPGGSQIINLEDRRTKFCQALYTINLNEFNAEFNLALAKFTTDSREAITNLHANATEVLTDYLEDEPSATRLFNIVLGKDGAGSGLDADLLDGKQGSYYLNYSNLANKPTIRQIHSGTSAPAASLGSNGDIYVMYEG